MKILEDNSSLTCNVDKGMTQAKGKKNKKSKFEKLSYHNFMQNPI